MSRLHSSENDEQEAIFQWAHLHERKYPILKYMFHIPNGGKRDRVTAIALRRQGVKAGVPDIMLPAYMGGWNGLFIELKVENNKPTVEQKEYLLELNEQGYYVSVCYGRDEAVEVLEAYLEENPTVLYEYSEKTAKILAKVKEKITPADKLGGLICAK